MHGDDAERKRTDSEVEQAFDLEMLFRYRFRSHDRPLVLVPKLGSGGRAHLRQLMR